jgi:hypothetical protein
MLRRPTVSKGGCEASQARMRTGEITLKQEQCHSEGELDGEARGIGSASLAVHVAAFGTSLLICGLGERSRVELPAPAWRGKRCRGPSELARLCSGFRLRAQTPAERLNFDFEPMTDYRNTFWRRSAQGDRLENIDSIQDTAEGSCATRFLPNRKIQLAEKSVPRK